MIQTWVHHAKKRESAGFKTPISRSRVDRLNHSAMAPTKTNGGSILWELETQQENKNYKTYFVGLFFSVY